MQERTGYAAVTASIPPLAPPVRNRVVLLNWAVMLSYALLIRFDFRQADDNVQLHPRLAAPRFDAARLP